MAPNRLTSVSPVFAADHPLRRGEKLKAFDNDDHALPYAAHSNTPHLVAVKVLTLQLLECSYQFLKVFDFSSDLARVNQ